MTMTKIISRPIWVLLTLTALFSCKKAQESKNTEVAKFEENWESLSTIEREPDWLSDIWMKLLQFLRLYLDRRTKWKTFGLYIILVHQNTNQPSDYEKAFFYHININGIRFMHSTNESGRTTARGF